jgi:hypothetical protein
MIVKLSEITFQQWLELAPYITITLAIWAPLISIVAYNISHWAAKLFRTKESSRHGGGLLE